MLLENSLCFQGGDPNGTRTRVFAVKGLFSLMSTARPAFHGSFRALVINDLQERGDKMPTFNDKPETLRRIDGVIAQLRHAYSHLMGGRVKKLDEFGRGLIAPEIRELERLRRDLAEGDRRASREAVLCRVAALDEEMEAGAASCDIRPEGQDRETGLGS